MKFKQPRIPFEVIPGPITLNSHCWKGLSAFLLDEETGYCVVISCPTERQLQYFWRLLSQNKLDTKLSQVTVGDYGTYTQGAYGYRLK